MCGGQIKKTKGYLSQLDIKITAVVGTGVENYRFRPYLPAPLRAKKTKHMINPDDREKNLTPKSTEDEAKRLAELKAKLDAFYADLVKRYKTDDLLGVILYPDITTPELVEGVKNKILTLSRN